MKSASVMAASAALLSFMACSAPAAPARISQGHPFGLWSSGRGQTIEIFRDGRYRFCQERQCEDGAWRVSDNLTVVLTGFADMKVTRTLRRDSRWDERRFDPAWTPPEERAGGLLMGDSLDEEGRRFYCKGQPCRVVGSFDVEAERFAFAKIADH